MRTFTWRQFEEGGAAEWFAEAYARHIGSGLAAEISAERMLRILRLVQPYMVVGRAEGKPIVHVAERSLDALTVVVLAYAEASAEERAESDLL